MRRYVVRNVVCDYGVYSLDNEGNYKLIEILDSRTNAQLICDILNADLEHRVYMNEKLHTSPN